MNKVVLISLLSISLYADFTLVYKMEGRINEIIQYKDPQNVLLRYTIDGEENQTKQTGQYLIDGKRYSVAYEDGNLTYIDLDQSDSEVSRLTEDLNISQNSCNIIEKPFFTILKKGGAKSIKGIEGEVWEVESQEDGEIYKESIVVTNNKELVNAMSRSIQTIKLFGEGPYGMEFGPDMESMMLVRDGYVLLSAEGIEFESLDDKPIAAETIALPKNAKDGLKYIASFDDEETEIEKDALKEMLSTNEVCEVPAGE